MSELSIPTPYVFLSQQALIADWRLLLNLGEIGLTKRVSCQSLLPPSTVLCSGELFRCSDPDLNTPAEPKRDGLLDPLFMEL